MYPQLKKGERLNLFIFIFIYFLCPPFGFLGYIIVENKV